MPELPDVEAYVACLRQRVQGAVLRRSRVSGPLLLRTVEPPLDSLDGRRVEAVTRLGKRIVLWFEGERALVMHLMIAGRLRWLDSLPRAARGRFVLASFEFDGGTLLLTEAGTKKRAAIHVHEAADVRRVHDPGGIELVEGDRPPVSQAEFAAVLRSRNHTLKRALTDPRLISGVGNAYSDEILHDARLSPLKQTHRLSDDEIGLLYAAARRVLTDWTRRLRELFAGRFPGSGDITAFRPDFAVHGRYGRPCPRCGTTVQRIRYAENETNYCPRCQTGGRVLADRSLSRILKDDWPATIEEWEAGAG